MSSNFNTRITLLEKLRNQHDDTSWNEFVAHYGRYIGTIILHLGVPSNDIDDLVQDTLTNLWKSLPNYDYRPEHCKFRSWLKVVTRNTVVQYFRKCGRSNRLKEQIDIHKADFEDHITSEIDQLAEREWKLHIAQLAWTNIQSEFNEKTRECYLLLSEGFSAVEVAEKMDLKVNTVHVFRQRIKAKLKSEIRQLNWDLN